MLLENKVALVTGASRGIGQATARQLAAQGAKVAINYFRSEHQAQRVKELIQEGGGTAEMVQADVTNADQVDQMVATVEKSLGPIDVLVTNAAMTFKMVPFMEYEWADFELKLTTELKATFFPCKAVLQGMVERKRGSIIAISSGLSKRASPGFVAHSTAKAALDSFVRSLATELGPVGVRVNTVAPGLTLTDATASLPQQQKDAMAAISALRRNGLPKDIAGVVAFLASDLAGFMTGCYLPVDGGFTML
jgi:NAD(P)-dependent dehydrogenase (short-subunit alcohol dehydrogenase family)